MLCTVFLYGGSYCSSPCQHINLANVRRLIHSPNIRCQHPYPPHTEAFSSRNTPSKFQNIQQTSSIAMESLAWLPGQVSHHPRFSTTQHHHGDCNRECGLQCGTLPLRPDGMETPPCATYPDYDGFMAQLCWEPLSDTHNGALGVFCPCVLYGKTYWRLDQQWTQFTIESHRADLAELRDREPDEQERAAIEEFLARTEHEGKLWDDSNFTCEDAFNEKCCSCFMTSCFTLCLCFCKLRAAFSQSIEL